MRPVAHPCVPVLAASLLGCSEPCLDQQPEDREGVYLVTQSDDYPELVGAEMHVKEPDVEITYVRGGEQVVVRYRLIHVGDASGPRPLPRLGQDPSADDLGERAGAVP